MTFHGALGLAFGERLGRKQRIQRIELMEVAVPAGGRTWTVIRSLSRIVNADDASLGQTARACILGKLCSVRRKIVDHPMDPNALRRLGVRRIGIVNDQRKALGALGRAVERKRWRGIFTFAGVFGGNLPAR